MKKIITRKFYFLLGVFSFILLSISSPVHAALNSRFEALTFQPAVDNGDYFTTYGSQNLKAWQGTAGIYFDYANRPLQFRGTGAAVGRQSIIDNLLVADLYGAMGFTDWFEAGINIPMVLYNWYFTDTLNPIEDHGSSLADLQMMLKFRIINTENGPVGFAIMPFFTLPSGDTGRFMGNGTFTGGLMLITDFILHERFTLALNLGVNFRDDVFSHSVRIDDQFIYKLAGNIRIARNWNIILEAFGKTTMRNFYQNAGETPFEAGGGMRYTFGDSGFAVDAGATIGIVDGVGAPRVRGFAGLKWIAPISESCPVCEPPAPPPDPRIQGGKIVLWGKIYFDTDKSTIKPISYPVLDDVVDVMKRNPQVQLVEVQGHCDIRGSDAYNMGLSDRRAKSVVEYLVSKGVESARLTSKGYGFRKPLADNNSKEGMSQNRRVEFVIMKDGS